MPLQNNSLVTTAAMILALAGIASLEASAPFTLIVLATNILSGSNTPPERMPPWLSTVIQVSPSTHFVSFAQALLYSGEGFDVVWPVFLAVAVIGAIFFELALLRFRRASGQLS